MLLFFWSFSVVFHFCDDTFSMAKCKIRAKFKTFFQEGFFFFFAQCTRCYDIMLSIPCFLSHKICAYSIWVEQGLYWQVEDLQLMVQTRGLVTVPVDDQCNNLTLIPLAAAFCCRDSTTGCFCGSELSGVGTKCFHDVRIFDCTKLSDLWALLLKQERDEMDFCLVMSSCLFWATSWWFCFYPLWIILTSYSLSNTARHCVSVVPQKASL